MNTEPDATRSDDDGDPFMDWRAQNRRHAVLYEMLLARAEAGDAAAFLPYAILRHAQLTYIGARDISDSLERVAIAAGAESISEALEEFTEVAKEIVATGAVLVDKPLKN